MTYLPKRDRRHKWQAARIYKYCFMDQCLACGVSWKGLTAAGYDKLMSDTFKKHSKKLIKNIYSPSPMLKFLRRMVND